MEIRVGSIVRLKSGSPDMVVDDLVKMIGYECAAVIWFDGQDHLQASTIRISSLLLVSDDSTVLDK